MATQRLAELKQARNQPLNQSLAVTVCAKHKQRHPPQVNGHPVSNLRLR